MPCLSHLSITCLERDTVLMKNIQYIEKKLSDFLDDNKYVLLFFISFHFLHNIFGLLDKSSCMGRSWR